jgi:hypothetical protein
VYHVYFLLKQKLVTDLLPDIVDKAEYWLKTSTIRNDRAMFVERTSGQYYVTSPPITGNGMRPVRRVIFTIKSHDQGWSDYREHHGTYEGSWTWFEARIIGTDGKEKGEPLMLNYNVHASPEVRTHTIVCERDGEDELAKWVRGLRAGEKIAVVPEARFPGWANHVLSKDCCLG